MSGQETEPSGGARRSGQTEPSGRSNAQGESTSGSSVNVTSEQRTQITQSVRSVNVPATNVNITSVSVGTVLPTSVTFVDVPPEIVRIVPAWRSYKVVKVRDEILIVDPRTRKIVYVIEV
jgi:hypothetical protein